MKRLPGIGILCSLLILILACSNDSATAPGATFVYPLKVGNRWTYSNSIFPFNITPPNSVDLDTLLSGSVVEILGKEKLSNSLETFVLAERIAGLNSPDNILSENFYSNQSDGLYFHGYRNVGNMVLPKMTASYRLQFAGRQFAAADELLTFVKRQTQAAITIADTLIIESPPLQSLLYPVETGKQWTYRQPSRPFLIEKRFIGTESISVEAGEFTCVKVQWLYGIDQHIEFVDFIAAEGLALREITIRGLMVTDETSPDEPLATLDLREVHELVDLRLVP